MVLNLAAVQNTAQTPSGNVVIMQLMYGATLKRGVSIIIAASAISLVAVLGLLLVLAILSFQPHRAPNVHRFMRTHVAAYFVSLLLCDVISTIGSLMNGKWVGAGGVTFGAFCTTQAAVKNAGNVGTALWSLVIAIHTFSLLVLKCKWNDYVLFSTLFIVWLFIGLVVVIGPLALQQWDDKGPYFGVSGFWCWITGGYPAERIALEYIWMFLSACGSFILYTLVFLSLRGNIVKSGRRFRFRLASSASCWEAQTGRDSPDAHVIRFAKHMLVYPIAYTGVILPIAICRFLAWGGRDVPFEATVFADTVFMLAGLVNVILFTTTRGIVSTRDALPILKRPASPDLEWQQTPIDEKMTMPYRAAAEKAPSSSSSSSSSAFSPFADTQEARVPVSVPVPAIARPLPPRDVSYPVSVATAAAGSTTINNNGNTSGPAVPKPARLRSAAAAAAPPRRGADEPQPQQEADDPGRHDSLISEDDYESRSSYMSTTPLRENMSVVPLTPHQQQLQRQQRWV